jgi:hypothetical protein
VTLKFWLMLGAIVTVVFGIGLVAATSFMFTSFGVDESEAATLMARLFGAAFIFTAVAQWGAMNSSASTPAVRGILYGAVVGNIIGAVVATVATINGVMNSLGWLPVALYGVWALVYIYFLFTKPAP